MSRATLIDVIGLLVRKQRTVPELIDLCPAMKTDTLYRYLNDLRSEGLIEQVSGCGVRGDPFVYRWVVRE